MADKPIITANQVTAARLVPMPLLAWLVYQGETGWWVGVSLGTVIASTDFVDGLLARKHGPTVLGGLLDPIADKVFIALTYLPLVDVGYFPAWIVGLMFVREFVVTALRSAYLQRDIHFRTSYLAKVKTWVQMQGMGLLMVAALVDRAIMVGVLLVITVAPSVPVLVTLVRKRRLFRGGVIMIAFMALLTLLFAVPERLSTTVELTLYVITGLSWLSGLDYMVGGLPRLHRAGGFHRADLVRLLGALAIPILALVVLDETGANAIPVFAVIALELSVGGLDNLLSRHGASAGALVWSLRTLGAAACFTGAALLGDPELANLLCWAAAVVSAAGCAVEFWRGRRYYLGDESEELALT